MILNDTVAAIADAIREKKGTTDKIAPVNFAEEIKGITAGGSGESGGSSWRYFDCKQVPIESRVDFLVELQSMIVKAQSLSYNNIMSSALISHIEDPSAIVAFGADMSIEINMSGEFISLGKYYEMATDILAQAGVVEITEAEFYDLNA